MRRLFWIGVGAAFTVVVIVRGRRVIAQYAPASLVEQAETKAHDLGDWFSQAVQDFKADFTAARDEREQTLLNSLLAETQPDFDTLRERRDAYARARDDDGQPASRAGRHSRPGDPGDDDDSGRRDEVEKDLGYSF